MRAVDTVACLLPVAGACRVLRMCVCEAMCIFYEEQEEVCVEAFELLQVADGMMGEEGGCTTCCETKNT